MFIKSDQVRESKHDFILLTSAELFEEGVLLKTTFLQESNEPIEPNFLLGINGREKGCAYGNQAHSDWSHDIHSFVSHNMFKLFGFCADRSLSKKWVVCGGDRWNSLVRESATLLWSPLMCWEIREDSKSIIYLSRPLDASSWDLSLIGLNVEWFIQPNVLDLSVKKCILIPYSIFSTCRTFSVM